ncbi:hypothetical protein Tco_0910261 [Tanacetum coccineum]|uniref:Uncharacterized protein n=1 Tax=Tanacetum coccineum TaxID=301880 RepID=A0ABQ5CVQ1_9ASTR
MWEAIKTHNLGVDRVKEVRHKTLITELENMKMLDNDTIDAYAAKLSGIASKSATLGEVMSELKMVKKFLIRIMTQAKEEDVAHTLEVMVEVEDVVNATLKTKVFHIWKAFGRIARDLGSFGEETDKTTDLQKHLQIWFSGSGEFLDPKKKEEIESWLEDSRIVNSFDGANEIEYFDTFPTLEELEYHEWLLKYPKPS